MYGLQLIIGPMFSGKSTELIRRCSKYRISKHSCVMVKYAGDVRYSFDNVTTHDNISIQGIDVVKSRSILEIVNTLSKFSVICIDEGQFFEDIYVVNNLANMGKIVIIAALDSTYKQLPFVNITNLISCCESVTKLHAVCMNCFTDNASFTIRITNEDELEVIGGLDKYMSVCRRCCNNYIYLNAISSNTK